MKASVEKIYQFEMTEAEMQDFEIDPEAFDAKVVKTNYSIGPLTANDLGVLFIKVYEKMFGKAVNDPDRRFPQCIREAIEEQAEYNNYDWTNDPDY